MTDEELCQRLRKRREAEFIDGYERVEWEDEDALEAADRIEELEAKLALRTGEADAKTKIIKELEAKLSKTEGLLAKAVEALRYYAVEAMPWEADDSLVARTTLAEIKGDKK